MNIKNYKLCKPNSLEQIKYIHTYKQNVVTKKKQTLLELLKNLMTSLYMQWFEWFEWQQKQKHETNTKKEKTC